MNNKIKVKFLRPIYPYNSGEVGYIEEKKAKYFKNQVEIIQEEKKEEKKEEVKPKKVNKKKNKAILHNDNNKWL